MRENVGSLDALGRTVVGGALVCVALRELGLRRLRPTAFLALGVVLVETAITRVCPMNQLLGLDTRNWRPGRGWGKMRLRGVDAWLGRDEESSAADLELPYYDMASFQRPPADS